MMTTKYLQKEWLFFPFNLAQSKRKQFGKLLTLNWHTTFCYEGHESIK